MSKALTKKDVAIVQDLWWFIENVTDETPDRTDRFFKLRESVREFYERNDVCKEQ